MRNGLEAALAGDAWSLGAALFGVDLLRDDEGRPVNERRAPSRVKRDVPMELRACPYHDARKGSPMNVSALAQVTRYLQPVLSEIRDFGAACGEVPSTYARVMMTVVDLLARPVVLVLEAGSLEQRVPAQAAVGYKLAAGFFGVIADVLAAEVSGPPLPATTDALMHFVHKRRALIGAGEVCAGPPAMIARACDELLEGYKTGDPQHVSAERVQLARGLTEQIQLGRVWEAYDLAVERMILTGNWRSQLSFRTRYLQGELERRSFDACRPGILPEPTLAPRLPGGLELDERIQRTLTFTAADLVVPSRVVADLVARREGAMFLPEDKTASLAARVCHYAMVLQSFLRVQWENELQLRRLLGLSSQQAMKASAQVMPPPQAKRWLEATLGHRIEYGAPPNFDITWASHRRKIPCQPSAEAVRASVPL